ncbi:phage tail family protein [Sutcliffiella horikoshii]|uniref:phage tail family protein n=1 Tax=Sutcliffiella horikoshii TaxID=79883 RepID=UPI00384CC60F
MITDDNFQLVTEAGVSYDMAEDFDVLVRSLTIPSSKMRYFYDKVESKAGLITMGKTLDERTINAECSMFAVDNKDYALLRNEIYRLFLTNEKLYLITAKEPGKRFRVTLANELSMSRLGSYGQFSLTLTCPESYAESTGTTADPLTFDAELWQLGQGLTADDVSYTHNTTQFQIYNAGDVAVDPRELPLKITFTGASTNLRIRNLTTGDDWQFTGTTNAGQSIVLDGVRATRSGLSVFGATNRKLITIAPGLNDFEITGATGAFTIAFSFRFYYV